MKLSDKKIQKIAELYNEIPADNRQDMLNDEWGYLQSTWRPLYKLRCERGRKLLAILNTEFSFLPKPLRAFCSKTPLVTHLTKLAKWAPHADPLEDGRVYRIHKDLECPDITAPSNKMRQAGARWVIEDDKLFLTADERQRMANPLYQNQKLSLIDPPPAIRTPDCRRWLRACWWAWNEKSQRIFFSAPVFHRGLQSVYPYPIDGKNIKLADICWVDGVVYLPE